MAEASAEHLADDQLAGLIGAGDHLRAWVVNFGVWPGPLIGAALR
jgi:hypothetical protein